MACFLRDVSSGLHGLVSEVKDVASVLHLDKVYNRFRRMSRAKSLFEQYVSNVFDITIKYKYVILKNVSSEMHIFTIYIEFYQLNIHCAPPCASALVVNNHFTDII